jgi:hypothetical protein
VPSFDRLYFQLGLGIIQCFIFNLKFIFQLEDPLLELGLLRLKILLLGVLVEHLLEVFGFRFLRCWHHLVHHRALLGCVDRCQNLRMAEHILLRYAIA